MNAVAPRPQQASITVLPPREPGTFYPPKIAKAMVAIKRGINPVAKAGEVVFGEGDNRKLQYRYPKSEDVLDEVLPLLAQHGLIVSQSEVKQVLFESERMLAVTYQFTIFNEDAEVWPDRPERTGLAWVRDKRGNVDDKASNKCATQAEKYFYIKFFGIRTSDAAQLDNDAQVPEEAADTPKPKPPRPGSDEAKALEEPRAIPTAGLTASAWVDAFLKAIEKAPDADLMKWTEANKPTIDKLDAPQFAAEKKCLADAFEARVTKAATAAKPTPPKPPRPGAPPVVTIPDPAVDPKGWIEWLRAKMATFDTHEAGETFWNDKVEAMELPHDVQDDAMGVWQRFEARFEP